MLLSPQSGADGLTRTLTDGTNSAALNLTGEPYAQSGFLDHVGAPRRGSRNQACLTCGRLGATPLAGPCRSPALEQHFNGCLEFCYRDSIDGLAQGLMKPISSVAPSSLELIGLALPSASLGHP
jgi:hypothetical protein